VAWWGISAFRGLEKASSNQMGKRRRLRAGLLPLAAGLCPKRRFRELISKEPKSFQLAKKIRNGRRGAQPEKNYPALPIADL
jgi:hypothetical protein